MIRHFLKDGTELADIRGHEVKMDDAPGLYALIDSICERTTDGQHENPKKP